MDNDDEYALLIAKVSEQLQSGKVLDRDAAIAAYVELGRLVREKARLIWSSSTDDGESRTMALYESMRVYGLLERGWGLDLYGPIDKPDKLGGELFESLLDVWHATCRVMPGYDLNKRSWEALAAHLASPAGQRASSYWRNGLRGLGQMVPESNSFDEARNSTGVEWPSTDEMAVPISDGDARIGMREYVEALVVWRFDDGAEPAYWEQRAQLTERLLGIEGSWDLFLRVVAQLPSAACPNPWGGSLGRGILEAPEEFVLPGIRAEQRGHFVQARNTYRQALTEYLSDLVVSLHPDVRHRFTTLGSLWDLGLPRHPERLPSAWDDFD